MKVLTTRLSCGGLAAVVAAAAGCAGAISYLPPGTTYGDITISKPRVSTRERLINDRLEEEAWLKTQLRETDNKQFDVQGKTDIRTFRGVLMRAGVQADSKQVQLYRETKDQEIEDARRLRELKALDFQIALQKKQKELTDAAVDPSKASSSYYSGQPSGSSPSPGSGDKAAPPKIDEKSSIQIDNLTKGMEALNQKLAALAGRAEDRQAEPVNASVSASPIDVFRDRLAYREEVRAELIQNALDDAHDLAGNTLYRLSFDATVVPGADTSAWAVIGVTVKVPEDGLMSPEEFAAVANRRIEIEAFEHYDAVLDQCKQDGLPGCLQKLRPDVVLDIVRALDFVQSSRKVGSSSSQSQLARITSLANQSSGLNRLFGLAQNRLPTLNQRSRTTLGNRPFLTPDEAKELARQLHKDLFEADDDAAGQSDDAPHEQTPETVAGGAFKVIYKSLPMQLVPTDDDYNNFSSKGGKYECRLSNPAKRLIGFKRVKDQIEVGNAELAAATVLAEQTATRLDNRPWQVENEQTDCPKAFLSRNEPSKADMTEQLRSKRLYAYGATPKETVQRVSEVLSRREVSEFALALQAVTGAASFDAMFNYIRANDALFHAIRRQPVVVGYSGALRPLGQDTTASFGWVIGPRYEIRYDKSKQAAGFRHVPIQNGMAGVISVPTGVKKIELHIQTCWRGTDDAWRSDGPSRLCAPQTSSPTHVVSLPTDYSKVFRLKDPYDDSRRITLSANSPVEYRARAGVPTSLLIRGDHLWRNTAVLLGGQEAERISVLPDMRGILAHFGPVQAVGQATGDDPSRVSLSLVTSEGFVTVGTVLIEGARAGPRSRWSLDGPRVVYPEADVVVRATPGLPDGFGEIAFRLVQERYGKLVEVKSDVDVSKSDRTVTAKMPAATSFKGWSNPDRAVLTIATRRFPNDPASETETLDTLVYYGKKEDSQATYRIVKKEDNRQTVELRLPANFREAYPAVGRLQEIPVSVAWTPSNKPANEGKDTRVCQPTGKDGRTCSFVINAPKDAVLSVKLGDGPEKGFPEVQVK